MLAISKVIKFYTLQRALIVPSFPPKRSLRFHMVEFTSGISGHSLPSHPQQQQQQQQQQQLSYHLIFSITPTLPANGLIIIVSRSA